MAITNAELEQKQKAQQETLEGLSDKLEGFGDLVAQLTEAVTSLVSTPPPASVEPTPNVDYRGQPYIPLADKKMMSPVQNPGEQQSMARIFGPRPRFIKNDIVTVNTASRLVCALVHAAETRGDEFDLETIPVGRIVKQKGWLINRGHKYIVQFDGFGKDGILESELVMVQPAGTRVI